MKNYRLNRRLYNFALAVLIALIFVACEDPVTFRGTLSGTVSITPDNGVSVGMELTANYTGWEQVSFQWFRDNNRINGATGNKYTPDEPGSYGVRVEYEAIVEERWRDGKGYRIEHRMYRASISSNSVTVYDDASLNDARNIEDFGQSATVHSEFFVANSSEWNNVLYRIRTGAGDSNYVINVIDDFSLNGLSTSQNSFGEANGITVSIRGDHSLSLDGTGRLLVINADQNTIIWDLGLEGQSNNTSNIPLVHVADGEFALKGKASVYGNRSFGVSVSSGGFFAMYDSSSVHGNSSAGVRITGGSFTMNDAASVHSNTYSGGVDVGGGGVRLTRGGIYTMNDNASVYGNFSSGSGGGVYLTHDRSIFAMHNSSSVRGNTFSNSGTGTNIGGGGVAIYQGTFRITGGVVYGSNGGVNSNRVIVTGGSGAALYVGSGSARYGILSGSGFFTSIGSLSTTENTFNVLNGFLY